MLVVTPMWASGATGTGFGEILSDVFGAAAGRSALGGLFESLLGRAALGVGGAFAEALINPASTSKNDIIHEAHGPDNQEHTDAKSETKLTPSGRKRIGNLISLKDTLAGEAIRERGGNASNVREALGNKLGDKTVGEIANLAGNDEDAAKALKIIKQAGQKGQRY